MKLRRTLSLVESELADLVVARDGHAAGEVAVSEAAGGGRHIPQGTHETVGIQPHDAERHHERRNRRQQEHLHQIRAVIGKGPEAARGKHRAHRNLVALLGDVGDRHAHHIARRGIHAVHRRLADVLIVHGAGHQLL